jgi:hypothetical protein
VRDFCVAVSALVPLLVLALTVETRVPARLARRQWEPFVSAIMKNPFVGGDEQQVFDRLLTRDPPCRFLSPGFQRV